jgi:hypothetical protein
VVGAGSGLGAVVFRYLIYFFSWLATGHDEFGQQGRVASTHLPWLGPAFFVVIPAVGGLVYGPLIYRYAREARGHGVPEVMIAVAENGGRIRPQVSVVKAVASAVCIGVGGSVGREGPIVQIGSALASSLGQRVRMPEDRLRILVACGAAGGIAATFNAPVTGVFFGVEIIVREFSVDALFTVMLAMIASRRWSSPRMSTSRAPRACAAGLSAGEGRCGSMALAWASSSSTALAVPRPVMSSSRSGDVVSVSLAGCPCGGFACIGIADAGAVRATWPMQAARL